MPTFQFREWLVGLIVAVAICFALTPLAARNVRWLRPFAWFYAVIMLFNGLGHTLFTILGHTLQSVTFPRPAPGFYSSPLLLIGSVWLITRLRKTSRTQGFS
jgi:multisubunit Na+/H+ antiporter MnhE subunit